LEDSLELAKINAPIQMISRASKSIQGRVEKLHYLSRSSREEIGIDVHKSLNDVVKIFNNLCDDHNVHWSTNLNATKHCVKANYEQFFNILFLLLINVSELLVKQSHNKILIKTNDC